jgi:acyl-CoA synthetase (AMP-forming)/AMP-acid ligase II
MRDVCVRILRLDGTGVCKPGELGEVCVRGAAVVTSYLGDAELTTSAQWLDGGTVFHRMGDVGALDQEGRLWVAGRVGHVVSTECGVVFPVPIEQIAEACEGVSRSALVGVGAPGAQRAVLLLEGPLSRGPEVLERVRAALAVTPWGAQVDRVEVATQPFPVDRRHNAKIDRVTLGQNLEARRQRAVPSRQRCRR